MVIVQKSTWTMQEISQIVGYAWEEKRYLRIVSYKGGLTVPTRDAFSWADFWKFLCNLRLLSPDGQILSDACSLPSSGDLQQLV